MKETDRVLIIRPLGPQGPKVGIAIAEAGDVIALDMCMAQLPEDQRKTVRGMLSAAEGAGLEVVDCSPLPSDDQIPPSALDLV